MSDGKKSVLTMQAAAKVNLYLEVLGVRPDGYHDLLSLVAPISLCDEVTLEETEGLIESTFVESDEEVVGVHELGGLSPDENLAVRVAAELKRETGYAGGARIGIRKTIPVGGGLGGGSADAAAVLLGLNELWGCRVSRGALMELGGKFGSDIPALVHGGVVKMEGRGEIVTPLRGFGVGRNGQSGCWMVLVNPGFHVSTRDIYSRYRSPLTSCAIPFTSLVSAIQEGDLSLVSEGLFNGLQETVFAKYPLIQMVAEGLKKSGALGALVSGSGASVFGLARNEEHAREVEGRVQKELGYSVWSKVVRTLPGALPGTLPDGVMVAHGPLEARV